ncbi:hypothetical protein NZK35_33910 [Stieleria sp. ICT_E10.1]|uniref:hypothetical protein n=1 Tax=Stieleria sedimenti TaxID=2976331 RepID=UPI00217FD1E0|nr:hypothetical protein [Stieleria sedimenti]MCS7471670.1 hypothetical protein [Stieleria sedimenti]
MKRKPEITTSFNALLILYSAAIGVLKFALSDAGKDVPFTGIVMTSLVDFVRFLVMMFVAAYFAREIWNRLVVDIFSIRVIAYREAITFVVALGLFFS